MGSAPTWCPATVVAYEKPLLVGIVFKGYKCVKANSKCTVLDPCRTCVLPMLPKFVRRTPDFSVSDLATAAEVESDPAASRALWTPPEEKNEQEDQVSSTASVSWDPYLQTVDDFLSRPTSRPKGNKMSKLQGNFARQMGTTQESITEIKKSVKK